MKSLKPVVLVLAGMLITIALFSFKNDSPKKEYMTAYFNGGWFIIKPDLTEVKIDKAESISKTQVKIINDLSKDGWELVGTTGATVMGNINLYFERVKQ